MLAELNISQLQTFQLVMQAGGYAAAAKLSHRSVPAIWQHIQALERIYGVPLFERSGRNIEPTAAAYTLSEQVGPILSQLESTLEVVSQTAGDQTIRLVTGVRMMLEDIASPLAAFRRNHPNHLVIRHGNEQLAEQLLLSDETDLALSLEPASKEKSSQIHYEPAYTVEFLAISKRNHPLAKSKNLSLREIAKYDLIVNSRGAHGRDALDQVLDREGYTANIVTETENSAFTIACVSAGMGVGVLAGRRDGQLSKKLVVRSLSQHLGRKRIVLMWRKGRLLTEPLLDLVELVKQLDQKRHSKRQKRVD